MSSEIKRCAIAGVQCLVNAPARPMGRLLLAHGAGAPMDSAFMEGMADLLCQRHIQVIRFEFPYMAKRRTTGRKTPPDRLPVLLGCFIDLVDALAQEKGAMLLIGGKSMGGRMATLVADGAPVKGMVCLGYPFHPIGKPEKLRTEHLSEFSKPLLIVQGTRDTMGTAEEVAGYALSNKIQMAWLESANHDLKPLKSSGFGHDDYLIKTADAIAEFIHSVK